MSTTLNFFHWSQIPFPRVDPDSKIGKKLATTSAQQSVIEQGDPHSFRGLTQGLGNLDLNSPKTSLQERAHLRAQIDATVADLFELTLEEFALVLSDFPLLDRFQPSLPSNEAGNPKREPRSTITRDLALFSYCKRKSLAPPLNIETLPGITCGGMKDLKNRLRLAEENGAVGYVPSEQASQLRR
jgi:hypothetical protein